MKKTIVTTILAALLVGAFAAAPAEAGKAKAKKVKFFLHGTETIGEVELANNFGTGYFKMDATEPADPAPKSVTGLFWKEHWNDCAGMAGLPVWTGSVSGQIKGTMKLTLHTINRPAGAIEIEIWPDLTTMQCASNDLSEGAYPEPVAMTTVDLPPGHDETVVTFKNVNFKAVSSVMVQITSMGGPASTRILYDSPEFASSFEFTCTGSC
jgi:hypothetical protein